ncbi:MAG TPA: DUF1800 domain-containing protein [Armatimonadota bacterium]|jgi:uncharacterized protein (DUF1800 family)
MADLGQMTAHLLRRAGFEPSAAELQAALELGLAGTLRSLLNYGSVPATALPQNLAGKPLKPDESREDLQSAWFYRLLRTRRPLEERMTLFWHNHFATGITKVASPKLMRIQNDALRRHATGSFADLLSAIAVDPAMLVWLDGGLNVKGNPNENWAREVMELFTLGVGNYTEKDVQELARIFTGWTVKEDRAVFVPENHDDGQKSFLGVGGDLGPEQALRMLCAHPATAKRLALKLLHYLYHPDPEQEFVDQVALVYTQSGGEVRPMLAAILTSPWFYSERAYRALVKSPVEYAVGVARQFGLIQQKGANVLSAEAFLNTWTIAMGQTLFDPPSVKGWDGGLAWVNSGTQMQRLSFAHQAVTTDGFRKTGGKLDTARLKARLVAEGAYTAEAVVEAVRGWCGSPEVTPISRDVLVGYLQRAESGRKVRFALTDRTVDMKVRGLLRLMLNLPEYQLA